MMFFKAYDQKTEYFLWGICINPDDITTMKNDRIEIPVIEEMKDCRTIVFLYHNSREKSAEFIKKISTENTKHYGNKEDFLNE